MCMLPSNMLFRSRILSLLWFPPGWRSNIYRIESKSKSAAGCDRAWQTNNFVYIVPPTHEDVNSAATGAATQLPPVGRGWIFRRCSGQRSFDFWVLPVVLNVPLYVQYSGLCVLSRTLALHCQEQGEFSPLFETSGKNKISLVLSCSYLTFIKPLCTLGREEKQREKLTCFVATSLVEVGESFVTSQRVYYHIVFSSTVRRVRVYAMFTDTGCREKSDFFFIV